MSRRLSLNLAVLVLFLFPGFCLAGIWTRPTAVTDSFASQGSKVAELVSPFPNIWLEFRGSGPTTIARDNPGTAFPQDGLDTINTEIVSMHLTGDATDYPWPGVGFVAHAEIKAGEAQGFDGFLPLQQPTRGQIQDSAGPPDGNIDFPAESFFDVFFDVWIDLDGDSAPDVGEMFSNDVVNVDNHALRMREPKLPGVPPSWFQYSAVGKVSEFDPEIGTFQALVEPLPLELYLVNRDRTALLPDPVALVHAATHQVPEPSTLLVWSVLAMLVTGAIWTRRWRRVPSDA